MQFYSQQWRIDEHFERKSELIGNAVTFSHQVQYFMLEK